MTPQTIEAIQKPAAIEAAGQQLHRHQQHLGLIALPQDFQIHDLEKHMEQRRRMRGTMTTSCLESFASYTRAHQQQGTMVFVDETMSASAVLNLGDNETPGHADHIATLRLAMQPAYAALLDLVKVGPANQRVFAEFIEDWAPMITLQSNGAEMDLAKGIAAVRKLTIEQTRKGQHTSQSLSESKSTFEQIEASSETPLPTALIFHCQPYHPLETYALFARVSILTSGATDTPSLKLHLIRHEEKRQQMANELCQLVKAKLQETGVEIIKGSLKS